MLPCIFISFLFGNIVVALFKECITVKLESTFSPFQNTLKTSSPPHSKALQRLNFFHFQNTILGNSLLSKKTVFFIWVSNAALERGIKVVE